MWRPILDRGDGDWVGTIGDSRLWVGTLESETASVDLDNPVFLWPLLEKPFPEVVGQLAECWDNFGCTVLSPPRAPSRKL